MKIAVFGTGGVGGYFGARLAAAGEEVHFIARGRHLEAMRENGLSIESRLGNAHVDPALVTDDPAAVGHADMVMVAVKLYDTDEAVRACGPLVGPDSPVVSFQPGVTGGDALTAAATSRNWFVSWYEPTAVFAEANQALGEESIDRLLKDVGGALGPPWRKEHRMAMAAAIAARR